MGKINLSQEELVAYGERHRLDYLVEQAINDAGRALHAADPFRASRYHLSILHRRAGTPRPGEQTPAAG